MINLVVLLLFPRDCHPHPQVSHHIYSESDLLAVDSESHSFSVSVAAPQSFLDQLAMGSQAVSKQVILPTPLPATGPGQQVGVAVGSKSVPQTTRTYSNKRKSDGSYSFGYSTSNGVSRSESGSLTPSGYQVTGSYQYRGPDGVKYTVHFVADENGYRPRISKSPQRKLVQRRGRTLLRKQPSFKVKRKKKRRKRVIIK
eukprot:GFUD01024171.1.p1 GENE.GFUD01024171.1~~GFUD01024171.1.p1  ORF type:complete len:199 (+),score=58.42 GFUD01024171.1:141-737(+)